MADKKQWKQPFDMTVDPKKGYNATFETNKGTFSADLAVGDAPNTVNNFVSLAREGYFDGTPFHRIVAGFVIQGGDPTGTGTGGPGFKFADEPIPAGSNYAKGTLAMANAGPNTNGSQFFVCLADLAGKLPKNYTIFGQVTSGIETVETIGATRTKRSSSGENSTPVESIMLEKVTIAEQ